MGFPTREQVLAACDEQIDCWVCDHVFEPFDDVNIGSKPSDFSNIGEAWPIVAAIRKRLFSVRLFFWQEVQDLVSNRVREQNPGILTNGSKIAWPDAMFWMEPRDLAVAAMLALARQDAERQTWPAPLEVATNVTP